ncbi:MAG: arsenate reductase ArsC [Ruminococcus sp.]|nr:arsenate reductase ArsC [Ruminococcus sp.]
MNGNKPKVAFICVHNSCRSQIAEALGKLYASDVFESYSAGTERRPCINQDAVRLMKQQYDLDMEAAQYSKLLEEIPHPDIAVFMGCNVSCPMLHCAEMENWGLEDPTGQPDAVFEEIIRRIEEKIIGLRERLLHKNTGKIV